MFINYLKITLRFSILLVVGNPRTALAGTNCIIISKKTAKKYWGDSDPLNKIIVLANIQTHDNDDNFISFQITGVFQDLPANTHFHADLIGSYTSFKQGRSPRWGETSCCTYFKMEPMFGSSKPKARISKNSWKKNKPNPFFVIGGNHV